MTPPKVQVCSAQEDWKCKQESPFPWRKPALIARRFQKAIGQAEKKFSAVFTDHKGFTPSSLNPLNQPKEKPASLMLFF